MMKARFGYVSNSSSSSWVIFGKNPEEAMKQIHSTKRSLCGMSGVEYVDSDSKASEEIIDINADVIESLGECNSFDEDASDEADSGNIVDLAAFFLARAIERFSESMNILNNTEKE